MNRGMLIGDRPPADLGVTYVAEPPWDVIVIGSMKLSEILFFQNEQVLQALAEGKQVLLYTPGLPKIPKNRGLSAALASRQRELKAWGILFTDGVRKQLITGEEARRLKQQGRRPEPGARMTPLAREILEGTT